MNCLSHVRAYGSALFRNAGHFTAPCTLNQCCVPLRRRNFDGVGVETADLEFLFKRFRARCYSSTKSSSRKKASKIKNVDPKPVMENEKNAFFVVTKGDIVGVYRSFADCLAHVGSSICDPPTSVFKGFSLTKDAEEYLASSGLKNALYTIKAANVKEDLFGTLIPCPLVEPASNKGEASHKDAVKKRSQDVLESENRGLGALCSTAVADPLRMHIKFDPHGEVQIASADDRFCILEFDGASKGNPGPAGAAAVLKTDSGNLICKLRVGLGIATCNAAEYCALIFGLKCAIRKGYSSIRVRGDSMLVCMQLQGSWRVRHKHMSELYAQAKNLKDMFLSFQIHHVPRAMNKEADAQSNLAVKLAEGQIQEELA